MRRAQRRQRCEVLEVRAGTGTAFPGSASLGRINQPLFFTPRRALILPQLRCAQVLCTAAVFHFDVSFAFACVPSGEERLRGLRAAFVFDWKVPWNFLQCTLVHTYRTTSMYFVPTATESFFATVRSC